MRLRNSHARCSSSSFFFVGMTAMCTVIYTQEKDIVHPTPDFEVFVLEYGRTIFVVYLL